METGLHPCARCAQMQRTCCQTTEILLTAGDVARIRAHTGREDFAERRVPGDPTYLEHDPADPEWLSLTVGRDGRRRMLQKRDGGDCTFLGAAGCVLPTEVRPLVCRLYPWSYTHAGLAGEDSGYCPTVLRRFVGDTMLEVLEMRRADAERWHAQLYAELGDERGSFGGVA
jgi:Fe-S-cluster containining protein